MKNSMDTGYKLNVHKTKLSNILDKTHRESPGRPRGGSRTAATSKVELFGIIVNGWKSLTAGSR